MLNQIQDIMTSKIVSNVDAGLLFCKNDPYSTIIYANDYFFSMIGYTREEVEELFQNRFALMVVDNVAEILKDVAASIEQGKNLDFEYRMKKKDGSIIWIHDTAAYDKNNNTWYIVLMDITEKKTIQYEMKRLLKILNHIPNKVLITDVNKKIQYTNIMGEVNPYIGNSDIFNLDLEEVIAPFIVGQSFEEIWERVLKYEIVSFETRKTSNHTIIAHDKNYLIPILEHKDHLMNIIQVSEDLMKQNDSLTGMPNRGMFENYYKQQKNLMNDSFSFALLMIDIDNFKKINDQYGHAAGDFVIQFLAKFLIDQLEEGDYISRYGGDEFVFLIKTEQSNRLETVIHAIMELAKKSVRWNNETILVTYSVGVAMTNNRPIPYHVLFQNADIALYKAKYNGKNTYAIYQDDMFMSHIEKQYNHSLMIEQLKTREIFRFLPYGTEPCTANIIKVEYDMEQFPKEIESLFASSQSIFEQYMMDEILELIGSRLLKVLYEQQEQTKKLCIEIPILYVLEKQFFIFMDKVMDEYKEVEHRVLFKVIGEKKWFTRENIEKIYIEFRKRDYPVIFGDFGEEVTAYDILLDFPTKYISMKQSFIEKGQADKRYQSIIEMIKRIVEIDNKTLLICG